jgi:hypothetical protein
VSTAPDKPVLAAGLAVSRPAGVRHAEMSAKHGLLVDAVNLQSLVDVPTQKDKNNQT